MAVVDKADLILQEKQVDPAAVAVGHPELAELVLPAKVLKAEQVLLEVHMAEAEAEARLLLELMRYRLVGPEELEPPHQFLGH